jgi:hypothetical protein
MKRAKLAIDPSGAPNGLAQLGVNLLWTIIQKGNPTLSDLNNLSQVDKQLYAMLSPANDAQRAQYGVQAWQWLFCLKIVENPMERGQRIENEWEAYAASLPNRYWRMYAFHLVNYLQGQSRKGAHELHILEPQGQAIQIFKQRFKGTYIMDKPRGAILEAAKWASQEADVAMLGSKSIEIRSDKLLVFLLYKLTEQGIRIRDELNQHIPVCSQCATMEAAYVCGACQAAYYCSPNCQLAHWLCEEGGGHRQECAGFI